MSTSNTSVRMSPVIQIIETYLEFGAHHGHEPHVVGSHEVHARDIYYLRKVLCGSFDILI